MTLSASRSAYGIGFSLILILLACKQGSESNSGSAPKASATTAQTTLSPTAPAPTAAAPAVNVDSNGIPAIPVDKSNPPTVAEWSAAREVNTQGANSQAKDCSMKIVREWLKLHCEGDIQSISDKDGFPKSQGSYFESISIGKFADFVFRIRKGDGMKMRIHRDGNRASFFLSWPGSKDRPANVALAQLKE